MKKHYRCVITSSVDLNLYCQPFLTYLAFVLNLSLSFFFFLKIFFFLFVIWKGPAGRTGLSVEQWSILIH